MRGRRKFQVPSGKFQCRAQVGRLQTSGSSSSFRISCSEFSASLHLALGTWPLELSPPIMKVLVGLSGGVDSSVAAALLVEQGHEVVGGYMKNWINAEGIPGDCPWEQDIEDARAVARTLGIEFRVIDLIDAYRDRIVDYL